MGFQYSKHNPKTSLHHSVSQVALCVELRHKVDRHFVEESTWQDCISGVENFLEANFPDSGQAFEKLHAMRSHSLTRSGHGLLGTLRHA